METMFFKEGKNIQVAKSVCTFKEGDIIVNEEGTISMFKCLGDGISPITGTTPIMLYAALTTENIFMIGYSVELFISAGSVNNNRLATKEEKHSFFTEAAKAGYAYMEGNWVKVPIIKDGDFVVYKEPTNLKRYFIFKDIVNGCQGIHTYANSLEGRMCIAFDAIVSSPLYKCQLATEEEKQVFINKLEEYGYTWDAENKKVEKIKSLSESWGEWAEKNAGKEVFYIDEDSDISPVYLGSHVGFKNSLPTKDLCKAVLAMEQLLCLRDEYRQGWKPDWNTDVYKYVIEPRGNDMKIHVRCGISRALSFPTRELAEAFAENFKDLMLEAKELL